MVIGGLPFARKNAPADTDVIAAHGLIIAPF